MGETLTGRGRGLYGLVNLDKVIFPVEDVLSRRLLLIQRGGRPDSRSDLLATGGGVAGEGDGGVMAE